mgnify:CR=1 FL=1
MNSEVLKAKQNIVSEIVDLAKESQSVIIAEYRGLTVANLMEIRRALRADGSSLNVYKNSLVSRAGATLGYDGLDEYLSGPNAIIFSKEISNGPKVLAKYAKKFPEALKIKGGIVEGKVVDASVINEVAKLPGREGLLSMFLSCLQAPVRQFACAVKAVADK